MPEYRPPVEEMIAALKAASHGDIEAATALGEEDVRLILDSAGQLAAEVLAPLNHSGDQETSRLQDGVVTTPKGFREAYAQYRDNGWNGVPFPEEFGGQGLPWLMAFPIQEMWQAANLSFGLCPLLNQGAVEAILHHGSDAQKQTYLPKLISGEWTGTMNLTEPAAGSDLSAVSTKAAKQEDGSYKITGQKIYITYGEHDLAENIIHLVLARTLDAPEGTKGISLFIVPKYLVRDDGALGDHNDVKCVAMEHKLGIHASPTCTMQFGDEGAATGYLVGAENEGLKYMFTMMNNARLSVGLQGVAVADRTTQAAAAYAAERVQGAAIEDKDGGRVSISRHPDVKRMLLTMRALTAAGRMMCYEAAAGLDQAAAGDDVAQARVDLLTPVVKSWCTDRAVEVASIGVQVHGGMGFVEETGAAQYYRDARILPIYEGTNGIQALDLIFRKTLRDGGTALQTLCGEMEKSAPEALAASIKNLQKTVGVLSEKAKAGDLTFLAGAATPFLEGLGYVIGAWQLGRLKGGDHELLPFYLDHILPRAGAAFASARAPLPAVKN